MKGNNNYELFAKNLKHYMADNNMTPKELSVKVGLHESTLGYYVSGKRTPSYEQLIKICKYIGCSIDEILGVDFRTIKPLDDYTTEELIAEIKRRVDITMNKGERLNDD